MSREWRALRRGESPEQRRREIERAYERFLQNDLGASSDADASVREVVLDSWRRSRADAVDPFGEPRASALDSAELRELLRIHPLASALPVLERLLLGEARDSGFIVAVGDAAGRLLWVDGDRRLRSRAEDIGFTAGTDWSEGSVGTSAPGSAIALDHSIQVFGAEHFNRSVHQWSCAATPVHDPETGAIIGVIDITGGETIAEPHVLPLVEATRAAVEAELKLESMRRRVEQEHRSAVRGSAARVRGEDRPLRLLVLGREQALLETGAGPVELGRRHAEILVALAEHPNGLGASALAEAVYGEGGSRQTLRAELVRLRRLLAAHGLPFDLDSRPYRLTGRLLVDAREALDALARGAHRLALSSYGGPVLPGSDAPAVALLRNEVDATLREALLQAASPELLFEYAQGWAEHDEGVWETLLQVLPPLSPKRARAVARLEQLRG